jgi:hypothetical protein
MTVKWTVGDFKRNVATLKQNNETMRVNWGGQVGTTLLNEFEQGLLLEKYKEMTSAEKGKVREWLRSSDNPILLAVIETRHTIPEGGTVGEPNHPPRPVSVEAEAFFNMFKALATKGPVEHYGAASTQLDETDQRALIEVFARLGPVASAEVIEFFAQRNAAVLQILTSGKTLSELQATDESGFDDGL